MNDKETKILEDEFGDIHRLMEQAGSCIRLVKKSTGCRKYGEKP